MMAEKRVEKKEIHKNDVDVSLPDHSVFNLKDTPSMISEIKEEEKMDLSQSFAKERLEWKNTILRMAGKIKDMHQITDLQVDLYSNRQLCLEHSHYLQSLLAKVNKGYKKSVGSKVNDYKNNHDIKFKMGEANLLVEASTADIKENIDLIQSQINYMQETIKTIDNIIYGIKYRIQIEEYRRSS